MAIAAALMLSPDLLLADEPASMLDISMRAGADRRAECYGAWRVALGALAP